MSEPSSLSPAARAGLQKVQRLALPLASLGLVTLAVGAFVDPRRALTNLLVGAVLVLGLSVGGMVVLALNTVANAGWHVVMKRVFEGFGAFLPIAALLLLAALLPSLHVLYEWAHPAAAHDRLLAAKSAYLNVPFFLVRTGLALGLWLLFVQRLRRLSLRQDREGGVALTAAAVRWSAGFLVIFAITYCMTAFDWLMSLEARWFSTVFGLYNVVGVLQSTMAATTIVVVLARRAGLLPQVTDAHLHDVGKLLFAFSTLWAYLWFSQFMLIWYANLPEETVYFEARWTGGWTPVFFGTLIINWALPFVLLISRKAKRNGAFVAGVAALVLVGRWLDLYQMAAPASFPQRPSLPGPLELAGFIGPLALFAFFVARTFGRVPLVARHDPYLAESLHHHS
jgi:hypothetical protein